MRVKILIGSINEKGLGKLQQGQEYDVPDGYAQSYIKNGWAEIVVDPQGVPSDLQAGVTETPSAKTAKEEEVAEEGSEEEAKEEETEEEAKEEVTDEDPVLDLGPDSGKSDVDNSEKKGDTDDSKKSKKSNSKKPKRTRKG